MPELLSVKQLGFTVSKNILLSDISFELSKGESLAIIGPNGAGKSTLLRLLGRFLKASQGSVHLKDRPLTNWSQAQLAQKMAFVNPKEPLPPFALSVKDYLALGRFPYQGDFRAPDLRGKEMVQTALKQFQLTTLSEHPLSQLSSGEFQRAQLARALVQEPELLLLDEPTSHLDIATQIQALEYIRSLTQKGLAVIMVLHDLNLAQRYSDRLLVLKTGQQMALGPPQEVLKPKLLNQVYGPYFQLETLASGETWVMPRALPKTAQDK